MNQTEPLPFEPTSFLSMLGNGFTLLGRTAATSGILTLLIVLPFSFLLTYGLQGYLTGVALLQGGVGADGASSEALAEGLAQLFLFVGITLFFVLAMLVVQTVTVIISWEAANGNRIGIGEALALGFRKPVWMILLQTLMLGVIMTLAFFAFLLLAAPLAVGATDGSSGGGSSMILSLVSLIFFMAVVYFFVATIFRVHRVAIEERGPWHGLIASIALVKGNWWRVFGLLVLIYFFVLVISLPFFALIGDDLVDISLALRAGSSNDPAIMAEYTENMAALLSWKFTLAQIAQTLAASLLLSNLLTSLYIDLRARRGELDETEEPDTTVWGDQSGV